jgi:apolipoprotein N-acyltransferase
MELLAMDWSGLVLTFFLIYGVYAPCLLTLLDQQHRWSQRLLALLPCLFLSWLGYWLSQRHLKYSDSA